MYYYSRKNINRINLKTKILLAILVTIVSMATVVAPNGANAQVFKKKTPLPVLDQKVSDLCSELASTVKVGKKDTVKIAIAESYTLEGLPSPYSRYLKEKMINFLFKTGKFKIIEKGILEKTLDEQKVELNGLNEGEIAKKLLEYLDVSYLVVGTIIEFPNAINVNARMVSTENGQVAAAGSYDVDKKLVVPSTVYQYRNEQPDLTPFKKRVEQPEQKATAVPSNFQNQPQPAPNSDQSQSSAETLEGFEFSNLVKKVEGTSIVIEVTLKALSTDDELDFGNVKIPGARTELVSNSGAKYFVQGVSAVGLKTLTFKDSKVVFKTGVPRIMRLKFPNAAKDINNLKNVVLLAKGKKSFVQGAALSFNF